MKYFLLFFLFIYYTGIEVKAATFSLFDVQNGLPENQIRNLLELPDGRILIATEGSLVIYNGAQFNTLHYKSDDLKSLDYMGDFQNYIDSHQKVWIKHLNSFLILDLNKEQIISKPEAYLATRFKISAKVRNFFFDEFGDFWAFTAENKLYRYQEKQKKLTCVNHLFSKNQVVYDVIRKDNHIFAFTHNGELFCLDANNLNLLLEDTSLQKYHKNTELSRALPASNGFFLFCNNERKESYLLRYHFSKRTWQVLLKSSHIFTSIKGNNRGEVLLSGENGLYLFDREGKKIKEQSIFQTEDDNLIQDKVTCLLTDRNQGLWIGLFSKGFLYYSPLRIRFSKLSFGTDPNSAWREENVRALLPYNRQEILVGTTNGLFIYNTLTNKMRPFSPELATAYCLSITRDFKGDIWISTIKTGCYRLRKDEILHPRIHTSEGKTEENVRAVYHFKTMGYWLLSRTFGAGYFDPNSGLFTPLSKRFPILQKFGLITHALAWNEHRILFASQNGFFFYDTTLQKVIFPEKESTQFNHSNRKYNCVIRDSRGWIWFGTQDGINLYQPENKKSFAFYVEDGLISNSIQSIIEDSEGYLWITTSKGISRIVIQMKKGSPIKYIQNFDSRDGLLEGEYAERSYCAMPNGKLYFGGVNGISVISPSQMKQRHIELTPLFSSLKINGKNILPNDTDQVTTKSIANTYYLELPYNQNTISLEFSALNYPNPELTYYRYRIEKYGNEEWTEMKGIDGKGIINLSLLPPGKYKLVVNAAGIDHQWGKKVATMEIVIRPPLLLSNLFLFLYAIIILSSIVLVWRHFMKRKEQQFQIKQEKEKLVQTEKLNQLKYRFITNVSHELRTPLTLIVTPLDYLLHTISEEKTLKRLNLISQGVKELRTMIDQLLDFRRIEIQGEKLNLTYNDVCAYLQTLHSLFSELSVERNIAFNLNRQQQTLFMWYDKDKLQKILNNLLNNAFKFTPKGGVITLSQEQERMPNSNDLALKIILSDTGCGISKEEITHVFERFYQADNQGNTTGSGIGLNLAMEYTKLHGGLITVESELGRGSSFTIWLPLRNSEEQIEEPAEEIEDENDSNLQFDSSLISQKETNRLKILLADDNISLLRFVADLLSEEYEIITACDGKKALELSRKVLPDLVISDIMMPEMDGVELCKCLKEDIRTSHIPVILLTAKTSDEDQLSGYQSGADAYISKPFNYEILQLRIRNIFELLAKRQRDFHQSTEVSSNKEIFNKLDEAFIEKAILYIQKNLDNSEYTVEQFSKDMGMDRTGLYRKLLSLVALSPVAFIRSIRMKEAAKLLLSGEYTITDVAYKVGYSTPRYFTKHFSQEFGVNPSEYK